MSSTDGSVWVRGRVIKGSVPKWDNPTLTIVKQTEDDVIDLIADIFGRRSDDVYLGEAVTVAEHMLQTAALAQADGASDPLVAAALLHDIGHFMGEFGADRADAPIDFHHELAGAKVLEVYFPRSVSDAVRLHVSAKRYLCAVDPDYQDRLSEASKRSLLLQGGAMTTQEKDRFIRLPFHKDAVRIRLWDDGGKAVALPTPGFDTFRPLLRRVLTT